MFGLPLSTDVTVWLFLTTLLIVPCVGLLVGSFLNVVIDRGLSGRSVVYPPSACEGCGRRLGPLELIPVVSWVIQGGKCRGCGMRLSVQYPVVETLSGVLAWVFAWRTALAGWPSVYDLTPEGVIGFVLGFAVLAACFAAAVVDLRSMELPDHLVLGVAGLASLLLLVFTAMHVGEMRAQIALASALTAVGALAWLDVLGSGLQRLFRPRVHASAADYPLAVVVAALVAVPALVVGAPFATLPFVLAAVFAGTYVLGAWLMRQPVAPHVALSLSRLELPAVVVVLAAVVWACVDGQWQGALFWACGALGAASMALGLLWWLALLDSARARRLAEIDAQLEGDPVVVGFGDVKFVFPLVALLVAVRGLDGGADMLLWLVPVNIVMAVVLSALKVKKLPFGPLLFTAAVLSLALPLNF